MQSHLVRVRLRPPQEIRNGAQGTDGTFVEREQAGRHADGEDGRLAPGPRHAEKLNGPSLQHFALILGLIAGTTSTLAFVPQVLKIWRERDCAAISLKMYASRMVGFALWLAYGAALGSLPLIGFNILNLFLGGAILIFKLQALGHCPDPKRWFCSDERVAS